MKQLSRLIALLFFLYLTGCESKTNTSATADSSKATEQQPSIYPDLLHKALKAHGGLQRWQAMNTLSYDLRTTLGEEKTEHHLIALKTREVLISGDGYSIGFDGEQVWVAPDQAAFGEMPARFYHNLVFYFFAMPFVLADPGIQYEDLGIKKIENIAYRALKISFNEGVGDADDDLYIAHFNPETYQLELLLYTVTYFSGEKHENYNALRYQKWEEVNGLLVPQKMSGYKYENDSIKEIRYEAEFTNIKLSEKLPDMAVFQVPEIAETDSIRNTP